MDPACVQADFAYDGKQDSPFFYWELQILALGEGSAITMGFSAAKYDLDSHPGWDDHSFALHGDDGQIFFETGNGNIWGPRFAVGDVVGCGVTPSTADIWYTLNGKFLGVAHRDAAAIWKMRWYPTMGMTSHGDKAKANFGAFPFLFSFESRASALSSRPERNIQSDFVSCSSASITFHRVSMLRVKPQVAPAEPLPEGPVPEEMENFLALPAFSVGDMFPLDPDGKEILLACREDQTYRFQFYKIQTEHPWLVNKVAQAPNIAAARSVSYFDESRRALYIVSQLPQADGEQFRIQFERLDCKTWSFSAEPILNLTYTKEMLDFEVDSNANHVFHVFDGYLYLWHPLGSHALRAKYEPPSLLPLPYSSSS